MKLFDLSKKIAIVTGGNQGIGLAIAEGLATAGATVIIANRRGEEGQKAAESLRKAGLNAMSIPTDVTSKSSIVALTAKTVADYGGIDILVNNAAVIVRKPAEETTEEEWDYVMDINLKGLFLCCQLIGTEMIQRKRGKIINISSDVSQIVRPNRSVYAVSKAGVSHLTRALALEWAKYNVNVNAIAPGPTVTPLTSKRLEQHPEDLRATISLIPLGRMGYPADHVGTAIFLASEASNFVTGQTLFVDGGSTLWRGR